MNILCCQLDIVWENKPANRERVRALLSAAAPPEGTLIVLPEMFATGFSMNVAGIAENPQTRETEAFLGEMARAHNCYLLGGVVSRGADGRGRNEAVLFGPDGAEAAPRYTKMHPFTLGGESDHYAAGVCPSLWKIHGFSVAPFICYDLRFPEIFRCAASEGAEIIVVIANWPVARVHHWVTLLTARAIENQAYVIGVNRSGNDPTLQYPGRSLIIGPGGEILADAGSAEGMISARLDRDALLAYREKLPFLADMRREWVAL